MIRVGEPLEKYDYFVLMLTVIIFFFSNYQLQERELGRAHI